MLCAQFGIHYIETKLGELKPNEAMHPLHHNPRRVMVLSQRGEELRRGGGCTHLTELYAQRKPKGTEVHGMDGW